MNEGSPTSALSIKGVRKTFRQGENYLHVLKDCDLEIRRGELVALLGPSGAGKSTLLQIAGLLERPDDGELSVAGQSCARLFDSGRTELRRKALGFVYQYHHLLPEFSALENVMLPQMIAGKNRETAEERAGELLGMVGLSERTSHRPARLSGGEQQRVAIARALANAPALLLADEPTGNLDPHTSDRVFDLFVRLVRETGLSALVATHNLHLAGRMDRILQLEEGRVVEV
jgi:lipoprotein-releasing system ATP-binding protein